MELQNVEKVRGDEGNNSPSGWGRKKEKEAWWPGLDKKLLGKR